MNIRPVIFDKRLKKCKDWISWKVLCDIHDDDCAIGKNKLKKGLFTILMLFKICKKIVNNNKINKEQYKRNKWKVSKDRIK